MSPGQFPRRDASCGTIENGDLRRVSESGVGKRMAWVAIDCRFHVRAALEDGDRCQLRNPRPTRSEPPVDETADLVFIVKEDVRKTCSPNTLTVAQHRVGRHHDARGVLQRLDRPVQVVRRHSSCRQVRAASGDLGEVGVSLIGRRRPSPSVLWACRSPRTTRVTSMTARRAARSTRSTTTGRGSSNCRRSSVRNDDRATASGPRTSTVAFSVKAALLRIRSREGSQRSGE